MVWEDLTFPKLSRVSPETVLRQSVDSGGRRGGEVLIGSHDVEPRLPVTRSATGELRRSRATRDVEVCLQAPLLGYRSRDKVSVSVSGGIRSGNESWSVSRGGPVIHS